MSGILRNIANKLKDDDVIVLKDKNPLGEPEIWLPSNSPTLDYNLGGLGIPQGIIEISGKSRSGKTTLALEIGKSLQAKHGEDGVIIILSSENRDNNKYALSIGVNTENVLIVKIKYVEEMFGKLISLVEDIDKAFQEEKRTPKYVIIWDSIGATLSKAEYDVQIENVKKVKKLMLDSKKNVADDYEASNPKIASFAKEAKAFAKAISVLQSERKDLWFIFLNHFNVNIGGMVQGSTSVGGQWIELMPTMRLKLSLLKTEKLKSSDDEDDDDSEVVRGQLTKVDVLKNDYNAPRVTVIRIIHGVGFALSDDDVTAALKYEILTLEGKTKKVFKFTGGEISWKTLREFYDLYNDPKNRKALSMIVKRLNQKYSELNTAKK